MFTTPQAASPTPPLSAFFAEVVCDAGASPPRTATSSPPNGGNCTIRDATRRRHAEGRLLMLQNPPPLPEQSQVAAPKSARPGGSSMVAPGIGRAAPMSARARPRRPLTRSWGSHTQARDAEFAGTRRTPPTKTPTFPHQHAEKSPLQQHVVSYNPRLAPRASAPRRNKTPEPEAVPGSGGGGWGIRTPEGLHPTRFPSVRHRPLGESSVHIVPDNHKQ